MVDLAVEEIGDGGQPDVRMRTHTQAVAAAHVHRTEVIEKTPCAYHAPLPARQRAAYGHAFAEHRIAPLGQLPPAPPRALGALLRAHFGLSDEALRDALQALARAHSLAIVEDAAHAIDARYKGRYLGTLGDFGCYSFHATKNIVCGEGGALVVNDPNLVHAAECAWEKGTDRLRFVRVGTLDEPPRGVTALFGTYVWNEAETEAILLRDPQRQAHLR